MKTSIFQKSKVALASAALVLGMASMSNAYAVGTPDSATTTTTAEVFSAISITGQALDFGDLFVGDVGLLSGVTLFSVSGAPSSTYTFSYATDTTLYLDTVATGHTVNQKLTLTLSALTNGSATGNAIPVSGAVDITGTATLSSVSTTHESGTYSGTIVATIEYE